MDSVETPRIEIIGLWRRFGDRDVLRDINLGVPAGEIHALVGPNGAGKSTLLRIASGLVAPSRGLVRYGDAEIRPRPRGVALVADGTRLHPRLTGAQNLTVFGWVRGLSRRESKARAAELLERVGLAEAADERVAHYSGGMRRRLCVARALLDEPRLLLVDEATQGLDAHGSKAVLELVHDAALEDAAVVWATHRLDELGGFADRVTVLDAGDQRFSGTVSALLERVASRSYVLNVRARDELALDTAVRVAAGGKATVAPTDNADEYVLSLREGLPLATVIVGLARYSLDVLACREAQPPLEHALLALTSREAA